MYVYAQSNMCIYQDIGTTIVKFILILIILLIPPWSAWLIFMQPVIYDNLLLRFPTIMPSYTYNLLLLSLEAQDVW